MESPYTEQENHAHYIACSSRLDQINSRSIRRNKFTFISSAIIGFFGALSVRVNGYSMLIDLIDKRKDINLDPDYYEKNIVNLMASNIFAGVLSLLMAAFIILLGYVGVSRTRAKVSHIILFIFYGYMIIDSIVHIGERKTDVIAFAVGTAGLILYYPSISEFLDFLQISQVEGYPHFNLRLTEQIEHPEYEPDHKLEDSRNTNTGMVNLIHENVSLPQDSPMGNIYGNSMMDNIPDTPVAIPHRGDFQRRLEAEEKDDELRKAPVLSPAEKLELESKLGTSEKGKALLGDISAITAAKKTGEKSAQVEIPEINTSAAYKDSRLIKPEFSKLGALFPERKPSKEVRKQNFLEDISAIANAKKTGTRLPEKTAEPKSPANFSDSKPVKLNSLSDIPDAAKAERQNLREGKTDITPPPVYKLINDSEKRTQNLLADISAVAKNKKADTEPQTDAVKQDIPLAPLDFKPEQTAKKTEEAVIPKENEAVKPIISDLPTSDAVSKADSEAEKLSTPENISAIAQTKKEEAVKGTAPETVKASENTQNEKKELSFDEKMAEIRKEAEKLRSNTKSSAKSEYEKLFDQYKI